MNKNFHALSLNFDRQVNVLITDCGIDLPITENNALPVTGFKALWDTGASQSVISSKLASALGLTPYRYGMCHSAAGTNRVPMYLVSLHLPNKVIFPQIAVMEFVGSDQFDVLIGMDVIGQGDFSITNFEGKTSFSFRVPSIAKIDYQQEWIDKFATPVTGSKKPSRNAPCPCGSGLKFKRCCDLK